MLQILKIEWLKLRKYRAFLVLSILAVIGIFGANYITYKTLGVMNVVIPSNEAATALGNAVFGTPFDFPDVFATVSYVSSYVLILPGLMMIMLICNEFSFRTSRQNIINGWSRHEFITGKILTSILLGVAITIIVFLTACLFGLSGARTFSLKNIHYIAYFFVQSLSYMAVAMAIAMLVKRSGLAIGIYFIYSMIIEGIMSLIISTQTSSVAAYLLPLKSADKLIPPPTMLGKMLSRNLPDHAWLLTAAIIWIALCIWFCYRRFEKSDLR